MKARIMFAVVAIMAAAAVGCTSGDQESGMKNTITQAEAQQRAESYVREAMGALSSGPTLETILSETSPCSDPSDNGPAGRVFASNRYWIRGLPKDQNKQAVDTLRQWSEQQGFAVVSDAWDKAKYLTLENRSNGFRLAIQESAQGELSIGASSPCVWPNGTPASG
ncbi:MAG: hypothetical protein ACJ72N_15255 [Labedaea sp.]